MSLYRIFYQFLLYYLIQGSISLTYSKIFIIVNTRELDRKLNTKLSTLYTLGY